MIAGERNGILHEFPTGLHDGAEVGASLHESSVGNVGSGDDKETDDHAHEGMSPVGVGDVDAVLTVEVYNDTGNKGVEQAVWEYI